jgi:hypothetical protein
MKHIEDEFAWRGFNSPGIIPAWLVLSLFFFVAVLTSGCSTAGKQSAANAYREFVRANVETNKQRTYQAVSIKAADGHAINIMIEGASEIVMQAPLAPNPPISLMPRDAGTQDFIADIARTVAWAGTTIYGLDKLTQRPTVVNQPSPVIVEQPQPIVVGQ